MAETVMPAAEAAVAHADDDRKSYEFAFHVLPTVAEGEVAGVFSSLKDMVTKAGGVCFDEEAPERIDLAYDIIEHVEGKNRKFHSAYFGWIRFRAEGGTIEALIEDVAHRTEILRYLLIKLTREEEANPVRFHEARKQKQIRTVEDREYSEESVSEEKLDESLERITDDDDVSDDSMEKKDEN